MFYIIKGKINLVHYFYAMLMSTVCLVSVVAAAYLLPHDKNTVAALVMCLSFISLGASAKVIMLTLKINKI